MPIGLSARFLANCCQAADAVVTWNENAAKAATAACLHISGNGLVESRMYAMVHVAIHDAVNAIEHRSRPYVFDAEAGNPTSLDAAVAAAARATLVSVIATLPSRLHAVRLESPTPRPRMPLHSRRYQMGPQKPTA